MVKLRFERQGRWRWLLTGAFLCALLPVVLAVTDHNRGTAHDPACLRHCETLATRAGPIILVYVGAPALIALALAVLLHVGVTRRGDVISRSAWTLAIVSCLICLVGLLSVGVSMLPAAVLTICAVASSPDGTATAPPTRSTTR